MSRYPLWAVLAPGDPTWLERRARVVVMSEADMEDGKEPSIEVIRGGGLYHAIVGDDPMDVGAELQLAKELALECDEPIYAIERANDPWLVMVFHNGRGEVEEVGPEALARSLGCPLPGSEESSPPGGRKPLRSAALIEGVQAQEAHRVLEEDAGEPLAPGRYRLEDTPRGLLVASDTGDIGYADITLSERFPHATIYGVAASPSLDTFFVTVIRGGEGIEEFAKPPEEFPLLPVVSEIKGERSPERILAALGIPPEWFLNE
jgi:hypothetical protein